MISKKEQRIIALEARRALSDDQRAGFSRAICEKLLQMECVRNASTILAYAATWDEVDPSFFCEKAAEQGKTVAYPVSYKGGIMEAYAPHGPQDWKDGILGIRIPDPKKSELIAPEKFDLVLVPCVAFDEDHRRLGHGGGYYDRYLPMCKDCCFVLIAFEAQKAEQIITDSHDILMHAAVTEASVY